MSQKLKDRTGIRYDRLIVIKFLYIDYNRKSCWLCKCDCGKEVVVRGGDLQQGHTKSCGCLQRDMMKNQAGKNHSAYIHGKYSKETTNLKEQIRKRDKYTCQDCGITQNQIGRKLDVHHIDGDDTNNIEENMITLCLGCHNIREPRRLIKNKGRKNVLTY